MPSATATAGPRQSVDQPGAGPHCGFLLSCLVGAGPLGGMKASPENVALTRSLEPAGRSAPAPAPCPVRPSELADGRAVGERHAAGPRWALCGQGSGPLLLDMTGLVLLGLHGYRLHGSPQLRQCPRPHSRTGRLPNAAAARTICPKACLCSAPSATPSLAVRRRVGSPATFLPWPVGREVARSAG